MHPIILISCLVSLQNHDMTEETLFSGNYRLTMFEQNNYALVGELSSTINTVGVMCETQPTA